MLVTQSPDSLQPHGLQPIRVLCPWDFPGKDTGVGCRFLLQRIFPTQGSNPDLLHCTQTLYPLSRQGSPKTKYYKSIETSILLIILVSFPIHPPIFNILHIFPFFNKILSIFQPKWSTYVCTLNKENNDILGSLVTLHYLRLWKLVIYVYSCRN